MIKKESLANSSQFISVEVKNMLRKSPAQFQEKLRKLKLWQNYGFLTKKCAISSGREVGQGQGRS